MLIVCPLFFGVPASAWQAASKAEHGSADASSIATRQIVPLVDGWEIQPANQPDWQPVEIDDSWEATLGTNFDGVATYRIRLPELPRHAGRTLLRFHATATHATVHLNGDQIGEHLGGWTPFQIDMTQLDASSGVLSIQVDERVGHNTQGFLPVFIPHFGGIWKPAEIILTPASVTFDDLNLYAAGWSPHDSIEVSAPLIGQPEKVTEVRVGARIVDSRSVDAETLDQEADSDESWHWSQETDKLGDDVERDVSAEAWPNGSANAISLHPQKVQRWSPSNPHLYRVEIAIQERATGKILERTEVRAAIRHVEANGAELRLNGETVQIRGVLNWGYAPPRLAPTLDEAFMRQELETIKAAGFNLMKFCLWIPPRRYLELCDEMGIMAWLEYPTWHPKLTDQYLRELEMEYDEFYAYDRNHPAVVLRSLTCETGPSAELAVIQRLYDQAHASVPFCLVEDDSSWIGWNRVHDFYDDHPYGNNHTWRATLDRLKQHIAERQTKPLMLGEAIAADTWTAAEKAGPDSQTDPRWQTHRLKSFDKQSAYLRSLEQLAGEDAIRRLAQDARTTALRMRKFQIETFRQDLPGQGYVVSVIRDFPFASMGLIDFENQFKWPMDSWSWHGQTMLTLNTLADRRSCYGGEPFSFSLTAAGAETASVTVQIQWRDESEPFHSSSVAMQAEPAAKPYDFMPRASTPEIDVALPSVESPRPAWLIATCETGSESVTNRWAIWVVPPQRNRRDETHHLAWTYHSSIDRTDEDCPNSVHSMLPWKANETQSKTHGVITRVLDEPLLDWLQAGGRVLMLTQGDVGAPPVSDHWFLRGGIVVGSHPGLSIRDADLVAELQTFDLAGPVMMSPDYLSETTPIALLWDNHDRDEYRTHALAWMAQVGEGRLLCSSLASSPQRGPASQYIIQRWMELLQNSADSRAFSPENQTRLHQDIVDVRVELPRDGWRFQPDREKAGADEEWFAREYDRGEWNPIKIGTAWDGQGYGDLDGFGWYALEAALPKDARYLTFTGVDDSFDLWIDGEYVGKGGDRETRVDAFSRFVTLPIPESSWDQPTVLIVVRVDDWQGAGGIFRPVFVSQTPLKNQSPILRRKQATTGQ